MMQALSINEGEAVASRSYPSYASLMPKTKTEFGRTTELYEHAMRTMVAKQQWASLERARQELLESAKIQRDCPFKPTVSPYAESIHRPALLRPENRINAEMVRRKQWLTLKRQEEIERELAGCTFRPLTLRTAKLQSFTNTSDADDIFTALFRDAEERQRFSEVVQPQVVEQMERNVKYRGVGASLLPTERAQEVVERLCAAATVTQKSAPHPNHTHKPVLSRETEKIIERKRLLGERDQDVVESLYTVHREALVERQLEAVQTLVKERAAYQAEVRQREEAHSRLKYVRTRTTVSTKFQMLAEHVTGAAGRTTARPTVALPVVALCCAALDVLTPTETEELLDLFQRCEADSVTERDFVALVLRYVKSREQAGLPCALATVPPPAGRHIPGNRANSVTPASSDHKHSSPPNLPRVRREKPDPEVVQQVRERREARTAQYRLDAESRENPETAVYPLARRLIPYECRPDVQIEVRSNRADQLRRNAVSQARGAEVRHLEKSPKDTARSLFSSGKRTTTSQRATSASTLVGRRLAKGSGSRLQETSNRSRCISEPAVVESTVASWLAKAQSRSADLYDTPVTAQDALIEEGCSESPRRQPQTMRTLTTVSTSMENDAARRSGCAPERVPDRAHTNTSREKLPGRLYRDGILEHAAYGGEGALSALGCELLLKQLQEYHKRRRRSRQCPP